MGYNLWQSADSRYTLGFRVGVRAESEPAPREQQISPQRTPERGDLELIDYLMAKVASTLQTRSSTA
jgi:hypothetical protein